MTMMPENYVIALQINQKFLAHSAHSMCHQIPTH